MTNRKQREVKLGVVEFHSDPFNPGLRQRFFEVVDDLQKSASIVDLWMTDLAQVMAEFGYKMTITTDRPSTFEHCDVCDQSVIFPLGSTLARCKHMIRLESGELRKSWQPKQADPMIQGEARIDPAPGWKPGDSVYEQAQYLRETSDEVLAAQMLRIFSQRRSDTVFTREERMIAVLAYVRPVIEKQIAERLGNEEFNIRRAPHEPD